MGLVEDNELLPLGGARHMLALAGIQTVDSLATCTEAQLRRVYGLHRADIVKVRALLVRHDCDLRA